MKVLSLSPVRFHILLSLVNRSATAALIAAQVSTDTFGEIELSPATLHDNLQIMIRREWLRLLSDRSYELTDSGRQLLEDDLYRWRIVTSRAIDRLRSRDSNVLG
jgi:DNA-binding PadR family transcriptional regulator